MKRIKAMNGYTIMQAVTARDEEMYNCEVGCYNVYFSSDIRDYGLTNSYPEYENVDSMEVAEMHCMGNYARACEIVESRTTCATYEEIEEVEKKLDSGMSELEIEEEEEREEEEQEKSAIETIKEHEVRAWTELQKYVYFNGLRDIDARKRAEWMNTDNGYRERLSIWCALNSLLLELDIQSDFNEEAMEYMSRYNHEIIMMELDGSYKDIETGEILTCEQLYTEYLYKCVHGDINGVSFKQWLNNCLTRNNGTLEKL